MGVRWRVEREVVVVVGLTQPWPIIRAAHARKQHVAWSARAMSRPRRGKCGVGAGAVPEVSDARHDEGVRQSSRSRPRQAGRQAARFCSWLACALRLEREWRIAMLDVRPRGSRGDVSGVSGEDVRVWRGRRGRAGREAALVLAA